MPLIQFSSKKALSKNISKEMEAGKPQKQAIAIGESVKRKNMAEGGDPMEQDDNRVMLEQCADEMLQAIESKDKSMLLDALSALVAHIQMQDQTQDQEMEQE